MPKYSHYTNDVDVRGVTAEARNAERVAEANRHIVELKSDILRLKIMLQAAMEIMVEQGVDPKLINAKIDEIVARPETFEPSVRESKPCPRCGRMIQDNGSLPLTGTCLYCGTVVRFPPVYGEVDKEQPAEEQQTDPLNGML